MRIIADTHVHLYDCYDLSRVFASAFANLQALAGQSGGVHRRAGLSEAQPSLEQGTAAATAFVLCLTERRGCCFFQRLRDGAIKPDGGLRVVAAGDAVSIASDRHPGVEIALIPGRQIVTCERLEVLALTVDEPIADGGAAEAVIEKVLERGGVPVLPWAPGKWLFGRGRIVGDLLTRLGSNQVLLGDTSMRARGWGEPALMRGGRDLGFGVIAGTDPLPFAGEERMVGRYGIGGEAPFDPRKPVESVRRWLLESGGEWSRVGARCSLPEVIWRLARNHWAK